MIGIPYYLPMYRQEGKHTRDDKAVLILMDALEHIAKILDVCEADTRGIFFFRLDRTRSGGCHREE